MLLASRSLLGISAGFWFVCHLVWFLNALDGAAEEVGLWMLMMLVDVAIAALLIVPLRWFFTKPNVRQEFN